MDSLNKLNDSLTKAAVDSAKVSTDSLVSLAWPEGKPFQVPRESLVVALHAYLTDSTVITPMELTCTELDFSDKTELLASPKTYLFKQIASGMNQFKEVDVQVQVASEKGVIVAKEHAYVLKNRLVGEGLNQKRITVATLPNSSNNEIIFRFNKRSSLK
jgi:formylmethanofuran dehydrogenase subunit D